MPETARIRSHIHFPGLASAAIEHPADRAALEALRRTPGLDRLIRFLSARGAERYLRVRFSADSLRISPRQCPRLYADLREACSILDVPEPALYLSQSPLPQAYTFGVQRHTIVMTTGLIDMMSDEERLGVIGHELGHIKAEHMLYRTMAMILADILSGAVSIVTLPGALVTSGLVFGLYAWFRKSELTADRAGLLTVQDPAVSVSTLLKLVGGSKTLADDLNADEFCQQAELLEDLDEDLTSLLYKAQMLQRMSHPFPSVRAREIRAWAESDAYARLMRGDYPRAAVAVPVRVCPKCGCTTTNGSFRFCSECGAPLTSIARGRV